ncbi:PREDICTED: uncharacterized protein LOC103319678 [Prunus mume]|uniref:Uncharacterized protein LOC103319678 n=1 Tax=Prunus mume TaxID=102107 RepID=A0ABM1LSI1_PRUMU|nr:PREDICTED: uncharacterized protein LOC103319678 [Prunus mume]
MRSYIERFIHWISFWKEDVSCTLPTTKQKIVYKVQIKSEKYKTKALKTAAKAKGVSNVSIEVEKELVEVTGVGVDSVCLAKSLQKKLGYATIVSVGEAKKEDKKGDKKEEIKPIQWASTYFPRPMFPVYYDSDGNLILN